MRQVIVWVLGLLLACGNAYWMLHAASRWNSGYAAMVPLFYNAIVTLVALRGLSVLLGIIRSSWQFRPEELITMYIMVAVATSIQTFVICSHAMFVGEAYLRHGPETWIQDLSPILPSSLYLPSGPAATAYFVGAPANFKPEWITPWIRPVCTWGSVLVLVLFILLCLSVLVRRQWRERDRLDYPLTQPVVMLVDPQRAEGLWRNGLFWFGFSIGFLPTLVNGLAAIVPTVPSLHIKRQVIFSLYGMGGFQNASNVCISLNPFLFGLGYLLPFDILFSAWVFYVLNTLFNLTMGRLGFTGTGGFPYIQEQAAGAWIAIIASVFWISRTSYLGILKQVWQGNSRDPRAPFSYRSAGIGIVLGLAALLFIASGAGMSFMLGLLFFSIYIVLALAMARAQAQFGALGAGLFQTAPTGIIVHGLGAGVIGPRGLAGMTSFDWLGREFGGQPLPVMMDGYRISEGRKISPRSIGFSVILGGTVAAFFSFAVLIAFGYRHGYATLTNPYWSYASFSLLAGYTGQSGPQAGPTIAFGAGFLIAMLLMVCQIRFIGWPLHPVGYAFLGSYLMSWNGIWLPLLVAWFIKLLVVRYGGLQGYRRLLPFFIGLVIGEFLMGGALDIIGMLLGKHIYAFWPY